MRRGDETLDALQMASNCFEVASICLRSSMTSSSKKEELIELYKALRQDGENWKKRALEIKALSVLGNCDIISSQKPQ